MRTENAFNDSVPAEAYQALKCHKRIRNGDLSALRKVYVASNTASGIELHVPNADGSFHSQELLNEDALCAQLEQFMSEDAKPNLLVLLDKPTSPMIASVNAAVTRALE